MVFVAAELGCNWRGNYFTLDNMIRRCKRAGVDAVKFQALSQSLIDRHPEWGWYKDASISPDNVDALDRLCKEHEIMWFCTPTYHEAIEFLDPFVSMWKVRHADKDNAPIVNACVKTGKRVVVSTDRPMQIYSGNEDIHQIYCIPKYPTDYGELNFDMISLLPGYSNHCLDPLAITKAVHYGAEYIEFHLSDNRDDFAIDNKVSMSYSQMDEIMYWIRKYEDWKKLKGLTS